MTLTMETRDRLIDLYLELKYRESAEGRYWSPTKYAQAVGEWEKFTESMDQREVGRVINEYLQEQRQG